MTYSWLKTCSNYINGQLGSSPQEILKYYITLGTSVVQQTILFEKTCVLEMTHSGFIYSFVFICWSPYVSVSALCGQVVSGVDVEMVLVVVVGPR